MKFIPIPPVLEGGEDMSDAIDKAKREIRTYERVGLRTAEDLCAEIERLKAVIDRAAKSWMSLEPPVAWEGDVADAMAAGVAEIERLREDANRCDRASDGFSSDLTSLDVSWLDLSSVTDMTQMFRNCSSFPWLDLTAGKEAQAEIERLTRERDAQYEVNVSMITKHAKCEAEIERLRQEMRRHLPILESLYENTDAWDRHTTGTGIATLNGYRAALAGKEPPK